MGIRMRERLASMWASEDDVEREEQLEAQDKTAPEQPAQHAQAAGNGLFWGIGLGLLALIVRLVTIFKITDPENTGDGWLGDSYHHWQIAYLSKQIGLWAPDGPRLWDLKGLEYFWGVLHPILLMLLMAVTGSIDIVLARLLTAVFAVAVVVLLFAIVKRHFGLPAAVMAGIFAALLPTSVFDDSVAMMEPIGVALALLGIWMWPKRGLWTGVAWALAAFARAEAWVFAIGMIFAAFMRPEGRKQRTLLVLGFAVPILFYMKHLLDHTGNPIYPVWWNFMANAFGTWEYRAQPRPDQLAVKPYLAAMLLVAVAGLVWSLWKRPRGHLLFTFGFGYCLFIAGMLGFTAYLKSWESWFWMTRFFAFPYQFAGMLLAIGVCWWLPQRMGSSLRVGGVALCLLALAITQLEWPAIMAEYWPTEGIWQGAKAAGIQIGQIHSQPEYRTAVLSMPAANPDVVYAMAEFGGIDGKYIRGQLYDPYYYHPSLSYKDNPGLAGELTSCWLEKDQVRILIVSNKADNYTAMVRDHAEWFNQIGQVDSLDWTVYATNLPRYDKQACSAADKEAR